MNDHELYSTVVVRKATTPIRLGDELLGGKICAASVGNLVEANIALEAECERLRVKLMVIASAEPARHCIEWAKAIAAECNGEPYAKWREAIEERDALAAELAAIKGQEPVAWIVPDFGFLFPTKDAAQRYLRNINDLRKPTALYTLPTTQEEGEK